MDTSSAFAPAVLERWWRRENLLAGLALMALAAVGWAYVAYQAASMGSMQSAAAMGGMQMGPIGEAALFLLAWTAMMVAMMVPATLPLILLYRTIARNRLSLLRAQAGVVIVLLGYSGVGLSRTTSVRLQLVGRCCRLLGGAIVCLAAHHRRGLPVHGVKAHLPRSLQQPIVLRDAQLAVGS